MARLEVAQFSARSDNFGVLLHDAASGVTAAIDAPDADAVTQAAKARGWVLTHILVTHHHFDHIEGIPALKAAYSCEVIGPEKSASRTGMYDRTVKDGDRFQGAGGGGRGLGAGGRAHGHAGRWAADG